MVGSHKKRISFKLSPAGKKNMLLTFMITETLTAFSSNQLMWQHDLDNSGKLNEESQSWDLFPLNLMSMFLCVLRPALSVCPTFSPSRPEIRGLNPSANRSAAVFEYAYYTNANMRGAAQDQPSSSSSSSSPSSSPPAPSPPPPLQPSSSSSS